MCVNKSWIFNKYNGQKYFVPCGHCPACLQEKAIKRTNRIRNTQKDNGEPYDVLFISLTYENRFIPYISRFQVKALLTGYIDYLDIKRDFTARKVSDFKGRVKRIVKKNVVPLDSFKPDISGVRDSLLKPNKDLQGISTRKGKDNFVQDLQKVGVVYLPDIQNFIKRLRINLSRNYNYDDEILYFYVCEIGPHTGRPHFHLLLYVQKGWYYTVARCVRESWPFGRFFEKSIQRAINPAAYVASYVNCFSTLPDFFNAIPRFRPFHHFSQNFGFGKSNFSLSSVLSMFERNNFGYDETRIKDGVYSRITLSLPLYVLNKYFRKFKGFSRLTCDEIFGVAQLPSSIRQFKYRIDAEDCELRIISVSLSNLKNRYLEYFKERDLVPPFPFEYVYSRIWFSYNSFKLRFANESCVTDIDYLQLFDNLRECFYFSEDGKDTGFIRHENIRRIVYGNINYFPFPSDPNFFPSNVNRNHTLTLAFESYDKDKKTRNMVYQKYDM